MPYMTLDQAIEHCYDVAEKEQCYSCAEQHLQLAEWLEELKYYRERYKGEEGGIH